MFKYNYPTVRGTDIFPNVMNPPAAVRITLVYDKLEEQEGLVVTPATEVLPPSSIDVLMHFVRASRQNYDLGVIPMFRKRTEIIPGAMFAMYTNQAGKLETIDIEIHPDRLPNPKKKKEEPRPCLLVFYGGNKIAAIDMGALPTLENPGAPLGSLKPLYTAELRNDLTRQRPNEYYCTSQYKFNDSFMWVMSPIGFRVTDDGIEVYNGRNHFVNIIDATRYTVNASACVETSCVYAGKPVINGTGNTLFTPYDTYEYNQTSGQIERSGDGCDPGPWPVSELEAHPYAVDTNGTYYHIATSYGSGGWWNSATPAFGDVTFNPYLDGWGEDVLNSLGLARFICSSMYNDQHDLDLGVYLGNVDSGYGIYVLGYGILATTRPYGMVPESASAEDSLVSGNGLGRMVDGTISMSWPMPIFRQENGLDYVDLIPQQYNSVTTLGVDSLSTIAYTSDQSFMGVRNSSGFDDNVPIASYNLCWPPLLGATPDRFFYANGKTAHFKGETYTEDNDPNGFARYPRMTGWMHLSNGKTYIQAIRINELANLSDSGVIDINEPLRQRTIRIWVLDQRLDTALAAALQTDVESIHCMLLDIDLEFIQSLI